MGTKKKNNSKFISAMHLADDTTAIQDLVAIEQKLAAINEQMQRLSLQQKQLQSQQLKLKQELPQEEEKVSPESIPTWDISNPTITQYSSSPR